MSSTTHPAWEELLNTVRLFANLSLQSCMYVRRLVYPRLLCVDVDDIYLYNICIFYIYNRATYLASPALLFAFTLRLLYQSSAATTRAYKTRIHPAEFENVNVARS